MFFFLRLKHEEPAVSLIPAKLIFKCENKWRLFLLEPRQNVAGMKRKDAEKRSEESGGEGGEGGGGGGSELQQSYELQLSEKPSSRASPRKSGRSHHAKTRLLVGC